MTGDETSPGMLETPLIAITIAIYEIIDNSVKFHVSLKFYYRAMSDLINRRTINPDQCGGIPCTRGWRIHVVDMLALLAAGLLQDPLFEDLPDSDHDAINAAFIHAREKRDHPVVAA